MAPTVPTNTDIKKPKRLPEAYTRKQVKQVIDALSGVSWIMGNILHSAGLRLMECIRLRVKGVDFSCDQILVREDQGNKDRVMMLPQTVSEPLASLLEYSEVSVCKVRRNRRLTR